MSKPPTENSCIINGKTARICSEQLFQQRTRIDILHRGETYRLQITRQGKLILTK